MKVDAYCTLGLDREYTLDEAALLRGMDEAGVARAVIAPPPRWFAVRNAQGNDRMLAAAEKRPDRVLPTCAANPWLGDEADNEVARALDAGARMLVLDPTTQGCSLVDPLYRPLIEAAAERGAPVYVHTGGYQWGAPAQLGLLAERFPEARFVMGHCGSTDFKADAVETLRACPNVYGETSLVRPFGIAPLLAAAPGRVLMGTAAPLNDLVFEWRETEAVLPPEEHADFYGEAALRLLGEDVP